MRLMLETSFLPYDDRFRSLVNTSVKLASKFIQLTFILFIVFVTVKIVSEAPQESRILN